MSDISLLTICLRYSLLINSSELTEGLNELLEICHIRTKASLKARGRNLFTQLPIILLGLRMRTSAFN